MLSRNLIFMKNKHLIHGLVAGILLCGAIPLRAESTNAPALDRSTLREELKNLTPEERRAKLQELREKHRPQMQQDAMQRMEEWKALTPEQRQERLKEGRVQLGTPGAPAGQAEVGARLKLRLEELRKKQADGTLTDQEQTQLQRLEHAVKQMDEIRAKMPAKRPSADKPEEQK
jgi:hypothetical protein